MHHTCIACIIIDSIMKMDKKNYPKFIQKSANIELKNNFYPYIFVDFEQVNKSDKSDTKLITKFK